MSPKVHQPDGWPTPRGYANAVSARGRIVAIAGQVGWDPRTETFAAHDFAGQAAQALENVVAALAAAGAAPGHVVRMTWYVTDREAYVAARRELGPAFRARFGSHYPAMSLVIVAGLLEPGALVEIEATAVIPDA